MNQHHRKEIEKELNYSILKLFYYTDIIYYQC